MKFKVLTRENVESISSELSALSGANRDELSELLSGVAEPDDDVEIAASFSDGCLALRIFDYGRYLFAYPYEISEGASLSAAISSHVSYAQREEIPLVFTDVPKEDLLIFTSLGFRHMDIDAEDEDCESYRVKIKSECEIMESPPTVTGEKLTLSPLTPEDIPEYARLSREESGLEFWGYDYREDAPNASDEYFYETAIEEAARGVAFTLAARCENKLVGEAVFYSFDRRGGADFAVRLLPEYRGGGFGAELFSLSFDAAREIGLSRLYGDVMKGNNPSIKRASSIMQKIYEDGEKIRFAVKL